VNVKIMTGKVADILGVSTSMVRHLARIGDLRVLGRNMGSGCNGRGQYLFDAEEVERLRFRRTGVCLAPAPRPKQLVTKDVAAILGTSLSTVHELVKAKKLPCCRNSGWDSASFHGGHPQLLFDPVEVEQLRAEREREEATAKAQSSEAESSRPDVDEIERLAKRDARGDRSARKVLALVAEVRRLRASVAAAKDPRSRPSYAYLRRVPLDEFGQPVKQADPESPPPPPMPSGRRPALCPRLEVAVTL